MYYLLEDNRIFDSENLKKDLSSGKPFAMEFDISKKRNEIHFYFLGMFFEALKIKKQSESVYDLIDNNDLIKVKMGDTFNILEVCHINGDISGMRRITAIYKPNSKGDYIKVWEKKDD